MSKKKKSQTSRVSNDLYSRFPENLDNDSRYKVKLGKSRKKIRKMQRKDAKRIKHEKKLEWIKRRKMNRNHKPDESESSGVKTSNLNDFDKKNNLKSIYKSESSEKTKSSSPKRVRIDSEPKSMSPDEMEVEYLEKQLLKNKRGGKGKRMDVLQELKSEFLRDGFDEDFLDFLSNITKIGDNEKVLDNDDLYEEDNTLVRHRSGSHRDEHNDEEEDIEDDEDDEDEEEEVDDDQIEEEDQEEEEEDEVEEGDEDDGYDDEGGVESIDEVKKRQIGLVNRLSEGNYTIILKELCEMYSNFITKGSKKGDPGDVASVLNELFGDLCDLIIRMIVSEVNVVISLVATQSALIGSLSNHFSTSILSIFLTKLFQTLEKHLKLLTKSNGSLNGIGGDNGINSKLVIRNIIISVSALFYYELIDIDIMFYLIKLLTKGDLSEDVLQLLLILLKYSGYDISKNTDIIKYLNELIQKYKVEHTVVTNRMKYIEDELNSNKKSSNVFDQFDYLKNLVNGKINMNRNVLNLDEFLNYNSLSDGSVGQMSELTKKRDSKKDELIKKAAQIGLNKDIQKTIFICIMNAISPENALNNITQIKLKNTQYNDVVNIIIYCYLVEKDYNFYYIKLLLLLTSKLNINITKRYRKYVNNNIILYFKNFESISQNQYLLLSKLVYHLIINKIVKLRLLNFISVNCYNSEGFKSFITNLFGNIVTTSQEGESDEEMEEYLIQELLSINTEKYFDDLRSLWNKYIQKHCLKAVSKTNSSEILLKSYQQIFS